MQLREGVETFQLRWPEGPEPLSVHVIETGEATLLFGTGTASTADQLTALLKGRGVDVAVIEHGDADHYGGAATLREQLGCAVAAPAGDEDLLREADVPVDHWLEPAETYWGVETRTFPGHTPGNMAFRYEDVVVAGDTVVGRDSSFAGPDTGTGPLAVIDDEYSADPELARESARALAQLEADVLLVTHGSNVEGGATLALTTLGKEL